MSVADRFNRRPFDWGSVGAISAQIPSLNIREVTVVRRYRYVPLLTIEIDSAHLLATLA